MSRIFTGLVTREFGPEAFSVQQIADTPDLAKEASLC